MHALGGGGVIAAVLAVALALAEGATLAVADAVGVDVVGAAVVAAVVEGDGVAGVALVPPPHATSASTQSARLTWR